MKLLLKYLFLVMAMAGYACMVFECFEKEREQNYQQETHDYIHVEKTTFQKQVIQFAAEVHFGESLLYQF